LREKSQARTGLIDGKQLGFSDYELPTANMQTKLEIFLSEMEAVVPWQPPVKRHCKVSAGPVLAVA